MLNIDKNLAAKWNGILNREFTADKAAEESESGTAMLGPVMQIGQMLEDIPDGITMTNELTSARFGFDGELVGYGAEFHGSESECQGVTAYVVTCWKCRVSAARAFDELADAQAFASYHERKTEHRAILRKVSVGECETHYCPEHFEAPGRWFAGNGEPVTRDETEQAGDFARSTWESPDDFHRAEMVRVRCFDRSGKPLRDADQIRRYLDVKTSREERFEMLAARIKRANISKLRAAHKWLWSRYRDGVKHAANNGGRHWKRRNGELKLVGGTPNWENLWLTKAQTQELSRMITSRLEAADKPQRERNAQAF